MIPILLEGGWNLTYSCKWTEGVLYLIMATVNHRLLLPFDFCLDGAILTGIRSLRWIFLGLSSRDVCRQFAIADQGVEDLDSLYVECIRKARPLLIAL